MTGTPRRIQTRIDGRVLVVALDRGERRNAVDRAMADALQATFDAFEDDDALSVAVIHGLPDVFSAGADLTELQERGLSLPPRGFAGLCSERPTKPLIAAVDGYALGGGLEVALACDVMVIGPDAVMSLPEVTHGLAALAGGVSRLQDRIAPDRAAELVLTGRRFGAEEALSWGLGIPAEVDGALATALRLARLMACHPLPGLRESVALLRARGDSTLPPREELIARVGSLLEQRRTSSS
jgi:enoyl-CoA hydratase